MPNVFANGTVQNPALPFYGGGAGLQTFFGTWIPPLSRVMFVRATGGTDQDGAEIRRRVVPTLAQGLAACRAGFQDTVFVLPGHTENVVDATMLTNLTASTRIIGVGWGSTRPSFRWTATGSQWAISANDVQISGLLLRAEGANGVVKAIAVTGNDVAITDCDIEASSGAANLATILLEVGTGAVGGTRFSFQRNRVRGVAAGVCTNGILISAAAPNIEISYNHLAFAAVSATGLINVNAAALDGRIMANTMANVTAASITAISFGAQASSGIMADCRIRVQSTGAQTPGTTGITTGATTLYSFDQNFITNDPRTNGVILSPAPDA